MVLNIFGLVFAVLLTVNNVRAQQAATSGGEVYFDHFGCWNCHGSAGEGGRNSRAVLAKTRLPLRRFVGYVRMPAKEMPPYASEWAPDNALAVLYHWLDGLDAVTIPPAISVVLKSAPEIRAEEPVKAQVEIEMTDSRADTAQKSDSPNWGSLSYRVTLIANSHAPVDHQTLQYQMAGSKEWLSFATDDHGEAALDHGLGFIPANARKIATARLRMTMPAARTVLVFEVLDYSEPTKPVVVGIGTTILKRP